MKRIVPILIIFAVAAGVAHTLEPTQDNDDVAGPVRVCRDASLDAYLAQADTLEEKQRLASQLSDVPYGPPLPPERIATPFSGCDDGN
jgi:hypothetical protein